MSFPRYPSYKDSGVEWLGEVPDHWEVKRLKHNLRLLTEKTGRRDHPVALENIEGWTGRFIPTETEFQGEGIAFDAGDILFGKLRPYLAKAYCAESSGEAVGDFHVMRPVAGINSRFAQYQILNREFIAIVDGSTFGSKMPRASWEFVGGMAVATPPLPEQTQIAAFLDRETAKIDELVAEQRRLMELLKEKRQAVISHAVTQGLNPHAPMKPSGIEWLGDVPEHWEIKPIRRVIAAPISNGIFKKKEEFGTGVLLINVFDIYRPDFKIDFDSLDRVRCDPSEISSYEVLAGDLFFVRSSLKQEGIAVVAVADRCSEPVVYECHLIRARPNRKVLNGRFGSYVLNSVVYRSTMVAKAKINTMTTIDQEAILSTELPIPPISEQADIAAFLDQETTKFDTLTAEAQRAIDLLQERRTALISAAVTGQIDVRRLAGVGRNSADESSSA